MNGNGKNAQIYFGSVNAAIMKMEKAAEGLVDYERSNAAS